MIHIGRSETLTTLCRKPVARRWWVEAAHRRYGRGPGNRFVYEDAKPYGADCPECLAEEKRETRHEHT